VKWLTELNDHLTVITGIIAALTLLIPQVRMWAIKGPKSIWFLIRAPFIILEKVTAIEKTSASNADRLTKMEYELRTNGGASTKDVLLRLAAYRDHDFWRTPRPSLEMDSTAGVHLVSQAFCELVRVSSPNDLYRRSWLRFIKCESIDDLLAAFAATAESNSSFRYEVRIITSGGLAGHGVNRGKWELRLEPITPGRDGKPFYCGYFSPIDAEAKEVATRNHWMP